VPDERSEERLARLIVQRTLRGTVVSRHDDGSRNAMVDAVITYPDGSSAGLEVVRDTDPDYQRLWARIGRHGQLIDAPDLRHTWHVVVSTDARIRELHDEIVGVLRFIEAQPIALELDWPDGRRWHDARDISAVFDRLGVLRASPSLTRGGASKVIIGPDAFGGWQGSPDEVVTWVSDFLTTTAADVVRKLANDGLDEGHAFIWATITTPYAALSTFDHDVDVDTVPTASPDLPDGVTHLWVGGGFSGGRILHFGPHGGWSEAYRIPRDGRMTDLAES
jgi:hypothetical protein